MPGGYAPTLSAQVSGTSVTLSGTGYDPKYNQEYGGNMTVTVIRPDGTGYQYRNDVTLNPDGSFSGVTFTNLASGAYDAHVFQAGYSAHKGTHAVAGTTFTV